MHKLNTATTQHKTWTTIQIAPKHKTHQKQTHTKQAETNPNTKTNQIPGKPPTKTQTIKHTISKPIQTKQQT